MAGNSGIGPTNSSTGYGYNVYRNNRGGSVDEVHQFSSTMVLDSRFGLDYHPFGLVYPGNSNFSLSSLNMTTSGLPYNTFPGEYMNSDGYAGLAPGAGSQVSTDALGAWEEILSKEWGRHSVRFGFEGNMSRYNVQNLQSGFGVNAQSGAGFVFDRSFTQQNVNAPVGTEANSGDPLASMMLGYFTTANYSINIAYALQQIYTAPFVQDDWRVNNKLTLLCGADVGYPVCQAGRRSHWREADRAAWANPFQRRNRVQAHCRRGVGGLRRRSSLDSCRFPAGVLRSDWKEGHVW